VAGEEKGLEKERGWRRKDLKQAPKMLYFGFLRGDGYRLPNLQLP